MSDDPRPASVDATPGAERGQSGGEASWPPAVPSGIGLRPRSISALHPEARLPAAPADPTAAPAPAAPAEEAAPTAEAAPPGRHPGDGATIALLDPVGRRIRLVRDAAVLLTLVVGVALGGSLLAGTGPPGAVLSATGPPGAGAGDPRGAPPGPTVSPGIAASPEPTPAATLVASATPAP